MPSTKLFWSSRAERDLTEIRRHIGERAPVAARRFLNRLRASVARLKRHPDIGSILEEANHPDIREILFGNYRIVYQHSGRRVTVLTVLHGSRQLGPDTL